MLGIMVKTYKGLATLLVYKCRHQVPGTFAPQINTFFQYKLNNNGRRFTSMHESTVDLVKRSSFVPLRNAQVRIS